MDMESSLQSKEENSQYKNTLYNFQNWSCYKSHQGFLVLLYTTVYEPSQVLLRCHMLHTAISQTIFRVLPDTNYKLSAYPSLI